MASLLLDKQASGSGQDLNSDLNIIIQSGTEEIQFEDLILPRYRSIGSKTFSIFTACNRS